MNVVTEALKQSTLYASSIQGGNIDYDSWRYDLEKSYPNIFKDRHVAKEIVGLRDAAPGASASIEVAAFGLAREMYLKTTISWVTPTVDANKVCNVASHLYKAFIKRVALLNSSREIQQIHGDTMQWKAISRDDKGERAKWLLAGKHNVQLSPTVFMATAVATAENNSLAIVVGDAVAQTLTLYTDLPFSFLQGKFQSDDGKKTSALCNYRFLETCRILVETAPAYEIATGVATGTSAITSMKIDKCELMVNYDIPSSADMMEIEKQYSLDVPLSVLVGNEVLTESSFTATATSSTHSVKVFNTNLCKGFLCCVHRQRSQASGWVLGAAITAGTSNGTDDLLPAPADTTLTRAMTRHIINPHASRYHSVLGTDNSRYGSDYKKITALSIKSSGRTIFSADTYEQLLLCSTNMCNWLDVVAGNVSEISQIMDKNQCNDVNFYWIPFCEKGNSNSFSGGLALKGLATCDVEVSWPSVVGVAYAVKVYSLFHQIISCDANSGRLINSVSS